MTGRGRGGRGGSQRSFNREQLNAMGAGPTDSLPGPVTQPPPLYPLLYKRPVPLTPSAELDYLLILRQDLIDYMQLSGSYVKMTENKNKKPEQEIDKLFAQIPNAKEKFDWRLFPAELRPKLLAKKVKKIVKDVNVEERLNVLEKLEARIDVKQLIKTEENNEEETEDMEEIEDEEMDDGTDYANNYFDNGEGYEDEDDNLEDGPIY